MWSSTYIAVEYVPRVGSVKEKEMKKKPIAGLLLAFILMFGIQSEAVIIAYDGFDTAAAADPANGIYQHDTGITNTAPAGGNMIGFSSDRAWTATSTFLRTHNDALLGLVGYSVERIGARQLAASAVMSGKTVAYGSVDFNLNLDAANNYAGAQTRIGFSSSSGYTAVGATMRLAYDGTEWDLIAVYNNGSAVARTVLNGIHLKTDYNVIWGMDSDNDTLKVWVNATSTNDAPTVTITDYYSAVSTIGYAYVQYKNFTEGDNSWSVREGIRYDNLMLGDTLEDMIYGMTPVSATILSIAPFSNSVMELVVSSDRPSACYPKSSDELSMDAVWGSVSHSTNGVDPFVVTNLDYSTASGTNFVIYIEAADPGKKFIKIGSVSPTPNAIHVVTDRPEALYTAGDPVVFTITLEEGEGVPVTEGTVQVVLTRDGAETLDSQELTVTGEALTVEGTLDQPGFLRCQATYTLPSGKTISAFAGAGFDPENIQPSLPPPDDFDAFWADQLAQLAEVPMNVTMVSIDSGNSEVEAFDVTIDCLGDKPVRAYVAWPIDAQPGSLPALMSFHGAGVRSCSLGTMVAKAAEGILTMDVNAHGIENGMSTSYYEALAAGELHDYSHQTGDGSPEENYFLGMFLRNYRAMEFLMARPEWDGKVFGIWGSSQGGGQALAAAGLNPAVNVFLASVPALCEHTGSINGWPRFWRPELGEVPDPALYDSVRYFDGMNFAERTQARALLTTGFIDNTCRPTSVYAAYNNLPGVKEILNFPLMSHEWHNEILDYFMVQFWEEVAARAE